MTRVPFQAMEVTKKLAAIEPYLLLLQLGEVWSNGLVTAAQLSEERGGGERAEREREERVGVTAGNRPVRCPVPA